MEKLRKKGIAIAPIERIPGRKIASTFWGEAWCGHLEKFSDYANRLPRGRSYVRNGSVCHLEIKPGTIHAYVSGSDLYEVEITIKPMPKGKWDYIRKSCTGQIGSLLELLQGRFSKEVMAVVTDRDDGLFPLPGEITFSCSCPDWAVMCKHVAAVLYGVGARLDTAPAMLFQLRALDHEELLSGEAIAAATAATQVSTGRRRIKGNLTEVFGFDMDAPGELASKEGTPPATGGDGKIKETSTPVKRLSGGRGRKKVPQSKTASADAKAQRGARRQREATPPRHATTRPTSKDMPQLFLDNLTGMELQDVLHAAEMSVDRFARALGLSGATIRNWIGQGALPLSMNNKSRQHLEATLHPAPPRTRLEEKSLPERKRIGAAIQFVACGEESTPQRKKKNAPAKKKRKTSSRVSQHTATGSPRKDQSATSSRKKNGTKTSPTARAGKGSQTARKSRPAEITKAAVKEPQAVRGTGKAQTSRKGKAAQVKEAKQPDKKRQTAKQGGKRSGTPLPAWTGREIAALRKRLEMSVAAFAGELGVTPQSVYGWEGKKGALALRRDSAAAISALARK